MSRRGRINLGASGRKWRNPAAGRKEGLDNDFLSEIANSRLGVEMYVFDLHGRSCWNLQNQGEERARIPLSPL
jgi:hypothetical protein